MKPRFLKPSDMKCIMVMKGVYANPLYLDEELMIMRMQVYEDVPVHRHENIQVGVVVDGKGVFIVDGEEIPVEKGSFFTIPSNVGHGVRVLEAPLIVIDMFRPPREDYRKYFEE